MASRARPSCAYSSASASCVGTSRGLAFARASSDASDGPDGTLPVTGAPGARSPASRGSVTVATIAATAAMSAAMSSVRTGAGARASAGARVNAPLSSVPRRRAESAGALGPAGPASSKSRGQRRERDEPDEPRPGEHRRREQDPIAVRRTELGLDLSVAPTLVHALLDQRAHLARCLRGRVLHREALTDRAAQLARDAIDALRVRLVVRPRRERERHREDREGKADEDPPLRAAARRAHRAAAGRMASMPVTSVCSSIGPMWRPAMTPSGPMKYVSGMPKTPYESETRPSSSTTVGQRTPRSRTYERPLSVESW